MKTKNANARRVQGCGPAGPRMVTIVVYEDMAGKLSFEAEYTGDLTGSRCGKVALAALEKMQAVVTGSRMN